MGILLSVGSHKSSVVEVLSKCCRIEVINLAKCCRRPATKTSIEVTQRLPWIGRLIQARMPAKTKTNIQKSKKHMGQQTALQHAALIYRMLIPAHVG